MNPCAKGLVQALIGVPTALALAMSAGLVIRAGLGITPAEAATPRPTGTVTPGRDALTVYSAGSVEYWTGRYDVASTHARRVEFRAEDYSGGAGKPPAGMLDDGYEVSVYAAGGIAFDAQDCALLAVDAMAGGLHVYMRCD